MSFEFVVRGHAVDPHNPAIKASFDRTVVELRRAFGTTGTVNGEGYSTDPSGTLQFDSSQTIDALAIVEAQAAANAVDLATAEAAAAQADAALQVATANQKLAQDALALAKKEEAAETPDQEAAEAKAPVVDPNAPPAQP